MCDEIGEKIRVFIVCDEIGEKRFRCLSCVM